MDLEYFKAQICEELDGAKDYALKAIEFKSTNRNWTDMLYEMANSEMKHAANLYSMFVEHYDKVASAYSNSKMPEYVSTCKKCVTEMYADKSATVKIILDMY